MEILSYPLENIDWFVVNETEAEELTGETETEKILGAFSQKFPRASVLLTLGADGAFCRTKDGTFYGEIFSVPVVDTTAAGDTFLGFFFAMLDRFGAERALKIASSASAVSVNRKRLINNDSPFAIKEAYVKLRTSLMFCMKADKEGPCKVFAITSANPSEGKSLTAANIAISYAMLGKKTLLIDADMRKPTQRRLWKVDISTGLCDFLAGMGPLELVKVENLPLSIVCTGTIPPNPSELLASDIMKQFIKRCTKSYDYVIIDTPPINTVADAQIISTYVDGVVVVAKSGSTTSDELSMALEAVDRAGGNLCGVVVNDMNMKSLKYSYKYSDKDKYGYKYSYEDMPNNAK